MHSKNKSTYLEIDKFTKIYYNLKNQRFRHKISYVSSTLDLYKLNKWSLTHSLDLTLPYLCLNMLLD